MTAPVGGPATDDRARAWYEAYGAEVYRFLRFHCASADEAEDLTAEVFFRVFRAQDRFDPARAEAKVWIFGIARNALRDQRRRAKVRRHVPIGALRDLECPAPSPEERLIAEERALRLAAAMARLPEADRELLALRYGSDMSSAEIGEVLGLKDAAVRTRLWRAVGRLRDMLESETSA